jgi:hypothetical protein
MIRTAFFLAEKTLTTGFDTGSAGCLRSDGLL